MNPETDAEVAHYYGEQADEKPKSLFDRLREVYGPNDFVHIVNPDDKFVTYQVMSPMDEITIQSAPHLSETYQSKPPKVYRLEPGQKKLAPAYEADSMVEATIKQMAFKRTAEGVASGKLDKYMSTDWTDPVLQAQLIPKIIKGTEDLLARANAAAGLANPEENRLMRPVGSRDGLEHGLDPDDPQNAQAHSPHLDMDAPGVGQGVRRGPGRPPRTAQA